MVSPEPSVHRVYNVPPRPQDALDETAHWHPRASRAVGQRTLPAILGVPIFSTPGAWYLFPVAPNLVRAVGAQRAAAPFGNSRRDCTEPPVPAVVHGAALERAGTSEKRKVTPTLRHSVSRRENIL